MVLGSIKLISFLKKTSSFCAYKHRQSSTKNRWTLNFAKVSEAAVIGISKPKLDDSVLSSKIQIENYDVIRSDRNRHGGSDSNVIQTHNHLVRNEHSTI